MLFESFNATSATPISNATNAANTEGLWTKFSNYLGSDSFANFGKGMQGVGAFASLGTNIYGLFQSNKALKMQESAFKSAQRQQEIENARFDKRERERDEATASAGKAAALLDTSRI